MRILLVLYRLRNSVSVLVLQEEEHGDSGEDIGPAEGRLPRGQAR